MADLGTEQPAPEYRAAGSAERAILVFRWVALASIVINLSLDWDPTVGRNPQLAISAVLGAAAWTLYLTRSRVPVRGRVLAADVALGAAFFLVSGAVRPLGTAGTGAPLLSLTYPFCPVLSAGAAYGALGGSIAGLVMCICHILVRGVNGIPVNTGLVLQLWPQATGYILLGLVFGILANILRRSSEEAELATTEAIAAREREARLAERESMARQIHDSVLQVLALIHKRGLQLAESGSPSPQQVMELAKMARDQEVALRGLIMREPDRGPQGAASLRSVLENDARRIREVDVSISTVGPVWLPGEVLAELAAAVREALANVVEHARASKVAVFADQQDGVVQVSIRDDGVGFEFDEARFRAEGKFGVLNSMRGRIEALGGQMRIDSKLGAGTEVEFQVPVAAEVAP